MASSSSNDFSSIRARLKKAEKSLESNSKLKIFNEKYMESYEPELLTEAQSLGVSSYDIQDILNTAKNISETSKVASENKIKYGSEDQGDNLYDATTKHAITIQEMNFLEEERKLLGQRVFLEKSDKPTSTTGKGIPQGILMLTNKRLFFFCKGLGKSKTNLTSMLPFGEVARSGIELAEGGVSTLIENLEYNDNIREFLNDENSFVLPLHKLLSCEKFGKISDHFAGLFAFKRRYIRISFEDVSGAKVDYCIYSTNPKNPLDYRRAINLNKWYKEIVGARAQVIDRQ